VYSASGGLRQDLAKLGEMNTAQRVYYWEPDQRAHDSPDQARQESRKKRGRCDRLHLVRPAAGGVRLLGAVVGRKQLLDC
jgi:hypothetical protein